MLYDNELEALQACRNRSLEDMGYSLDDEGYERYAADHCYRDADIMYGRVPSGIDAELMNLAEEDVDAEKEEPKNALQIVLERHGKTLDDLDIDLHPSRDRALWAIGIDPRELIAEEKVQDERHKRSVKKVGRAAVKRSNKKKGKEEDDLPF